MDNYNNNGYNNDSWNNPQGNGPDPQHLNQRYQVFNRNLTEDMGQPFQIII